MTYKSKLKAFGMVLMVGALIIILAACETSGVIDDLPIDDDLTIVEVEYDLDDNLVFDLGTSESEIINELPDKITVTFNDGEIKEFDLDWTASADFDSDTEGEYIFTGSYEVPGFDVDPVEEEIEIADETIVEVTENINEETVWETGRIYRVLNDIDINADLTIEPGVVIEFSDETGLELTGTNIIKAGNVESTSTANIDNDDLIVFTAIDEALGWDGIVIDSSHPENAMDNILIEYAGNNGAALIVRDDAHLTLTDSKIENSFAYGLELQGLNASFADSENNIYTNNEEAPVILTDNTMHYLDSGSEFTGNNNDFILVEEGNSTDDATSDQVIQPLDVAYRISENLVFDDNEIQVIAGTVFEFMEDAGFRFDEESRVKIGINQHEESEEEPERVQDQVVLTSVTPQPGWWRGISILSPYDDNSINNTLIEYGGKEHRVGSETLHKANLYIDSGAYVNLSNSEISNSKGDGLRMRRSDSDIDMANNEFNNNEEAPIRIRHENIKNMSSTSTFSNNGRNYVRVFNTSSTNHEVLEETWEGLDIPYRFEFSLDVRGDSTINIEPGAEFEFTSDKHIRFRENSRLIAEGEENNEILFTGYDDLNWKGLKIINDNENILENVIIEQGGSDRIGNSTRTEDANLVIRDSLNVTIENITLRDSAGYGLQLRNSQINGSDDLADFEDQISFSNNAAGDFTE